ncbi:MAG: hypothetical protein ACXAAT_16635, partial [Candidatus Hodarchaeales archaeon]
MGKPLEPGTWRYSYYTALGKAWDDFSVDVPLKELTDEVINR